MKYILRKAVLGSVPEVEISESDYLELQKAQNTPKRTEEKDGGVASRKRTEGSRLHISQI